MTLALTLRMGVATLPTVTSAVGSDGKSSVSVPPRVGSACKAGAKASNTLARSRPRLASRVMAVRVVAIGVKVWVWVWFKVRLWIGFGVDVTLVAPGRRCAPGPR
ncbi:hypothetical protein D3C87_1718120 [compost metagenome]